MNTDDDLSYFVGGKFVGAEIRDGGSIPSDEDHDVEFLIVNTSKGSFTIANHNEHNGYYGGFSIRMRKVSKKNDDA